MTDGKIPITTFANAIFAIYSRVDNDFLSLLSKFWTTEKEFQN